MTDVDTKKHCGSCRHHHKEVRDRVLNVGSSIEDVLEQTMTHDGSADDIMAHGPEQHEEIYHCRKQANAIIGVGSKLRKTDDGLLVATEPDAAAELGKDCPLWEAGMKRPARLSPALEARMAELDAKTDEPE